MSAALSESGRSLAGTFPRDRMLFCLSVGLEALYHRLRGVDFRPYIHSPRAIAETADRAGFDVAFDDRDFGWHGVVFERAS